jgi:putative hemolysin
VSILLGDIVFLAILVLINAFFAASEIALISLNDNKIKLMAADGNKKAKKLKKLLSEPTKFLSTIQVGITLAGFFASALASESFATIVVDSLKTLPLAIPENVLKTIAVIIITLILSYFTLVFGELVPKRLAMKKAEPIAFFAVTPLHLLSLVSAPFVRLLTASTNFFVKLLGVDPHSDDNQVTEEEIRMMVDVGEEKGTIHEAERVMINNIFEFDNKIVSDVMTHRTNIVAIADDASFDEIIALILHEQFTRFPVYSENVDNVIGILHVKDLLPFIGDKQDNPFQLSAILRKPLFVPTSKRTDELFKDLQRTKTHLAIAIDEYGGTAGLVTIEDLIEEIVGNIFDEYDDISHEFEQLDANTFVIKGNYSLDLVEDLLEVKLPTDDYDTLSGFIIGQLGRIPEATEKPLVEFNNVIFKVEHIEDKRITSVKAYRTKEI